MNIEHNANHETMYVVTFDKMMKHVNATTMKREYVFVINVNIDNATSYVREHVENDARTHALESLWIPRMMFDETQFTMRVDVEIEQSQIVYFNDDHDDAYVSHDFIVVVTCVQR